jgi:hypothetical protein
VLVACKSMSAESVLSNQDLVRKLLKHSNATVGILRASKMIRLGEECSDLYERWARLGCPATRALGVREMRCLGAVEGSGFCSGTWQVDGSEISTTALVSRIQKCLHIDPQTTSTTHILLSFGRERIAIWLSPSWNELTTVFDGWRRKGVRCTPTTEQVRRLLQTIATTVGEVTLPCPKRSRALTSVVVPRDLKLSIGRFDGETEDILLSATRS